MAKTAARKRFSTGGGTPVRVSAPPVTASTADPFAAYVKNLNNQLKVFQDEAALKKLADGDPEGFIPLAKQRLNEGNTSYPWADLIKQAEQRIDQTKWAADVKDGTKSLEDFKTHLETQLKDLQPGSTEAQQALKNIATVNSSIKSRDEAALDQKALQKYINDGDHKAYRDYLDAKLTRTVDPAMQTALVKDIKTLDDRIAASASVDRAQKVSDAQTAFRQGTSAAETVAKLQEIARDKSISAAEVNHIQTVIDAVFNKAAADAKAAASGNAAAAGARVTATLNAERTALEAAKANIDNKLKAGQPITQADLDRVDTAAAVVQHVSEAIASDPNTTASTSRTSANEAAAAGKAPNDVRGLIDAKTLKDFGLDASGKTTFTDSLKGLSAAQQAQEWIDRARESNMALGKLYLDDNKTLANNLSSQAYSLAKQQIGVLTKPAPLTQDEKDSMHNQYLDYRDAMVSRGLTPKSEAEFGRTASSSPDAQTAATNLGLPADAVAGFTPIFNNDISPLVNRGAKYTDGELTGDPQSKANLDAAMTLQDRLIRAQFGNDVSLDKSGLYYVAAGLVSPQDAVRTIGQAQAAIPRRGGSLGDNGLPTETSRGLQPSMSSDTASMGGKQADYGQPAQEQQAGDNLFDSGNGQTSTGLGGYLGDQRQELFGNQDLYGGATNYLTQNSFVDLPAWSMPEMPAWDPMVFGSPGDNSLDRGAYFGEPDNTPTVNTPPPMGDQAPTEPSSTSFLTE